MGEYYIAHSSGPWKKHKYIKKVGDHYYYDDEDGESVVDDVKSTAKHTLNKAKKFVDGILNGTRKPKRSKNTINLGGGVLATFGEAKTGSAAKKKHKNKINLGGGVSVSYGKVTIS